MFHVVEDGNSDNSIVVRRGYSTIRRISLFVNLVLCFQSLRRSFRSQLKLSITVSHFERGLIVICWFHDVVNTWFARAVEQRWKMKNSSWIISAKEKTFSSRDDMYALREPLPLFRNFLGLFVRKMHGSGTKQPILNETKQPILKQFKIADW